MTSINPFETTSFCEISNVLSAIFPNGSFGLFNCRNSVIKEDKSLLIEILSISSVCDSSRKGIN